MLCEVTDLKGNHCPEEPTHEVEFRGKIIHLCDRCYANVQLGAYMAHLTMRAVDLLDEQAKLAVLKNPQTTNARRSASCCET